MEDNILKKEINTIHKGDINYILKEGKLVKYQPWLGDLFSFLYDRIMEKSIFPKKFNASYKNHLAFLQSEFIAFPKKAALELATGSGNAAEFLPKDVLYTGTDISPGLLKIANKKFLKAKFCCTDLYVCSAEELPFADDSFDLSICNLSFNFFPDLRKVISELSRVLKVKGYLFCSVPVPERNKNNKIIRGKLFSENDLREMFQDSGFEFIPYDFVNGAIFYFKAYKE
jgi:ubiquinone/menaquinone biosynthesis C-methylase UbiE